MAEKHKCPICGHMTLNIKGEVKWNKSHTLQKISEVRYCERVIPEDTRTNCFRSTKVYIIDSSGYELAYMYHSESLAGTKVSNDRGDGKYFDMWWNDTDSD